MVDLCIISKILERVVYNQLNAYLDENNLIYEFQSGFHKGYSTDTYFIYMTDYIRKKIDTGNYTGMVLLDLQKALDTIDHKILMYKLRLCGMHDNSIQWFASYFSSRKHEVDINGVMSYFNSINYGTPHNSILGPFRLFLNVNDMPSAVRCQVLM